MIWLIPILLLGIFLWWGLDNIFKTRRADDWWNDNPLPGISLVVVLLLLIILPCVAISYSASYAKLEVFYQANSRNYEIAVDETASYLSEKDFTQALIDGSIEKIELAGYVSERISEWRDAVNGYNTQIANMKYYDSNIFLGALYPDAVRDAKLLIIK